ncbi:MAG: hypothetical protein ACO1QB_13820 [Verrucomicrobiales bacterium]
MIVLGTHLFELMIFFAGDPLWCSARILEKGKEITRNDAKKATEEIGTIYGDDIQAQFSFRNGVFGTFTSKASHREIAGLWGMDIIGEKGRVHILAEVFPTCFIAKADDWSSDGRSVRWEPIPGDPAVDVPRQCFRQDWKNAGRCSLLAEADYNIPVSQDKE